MENIMMKFVTVFSVLIILLWGIVFAGSTGPAGNRTEQELTGAGWYAWLDKNASWQNDVVHPDSFNLATMPVNAPSVGWNSLFYNPLPWQSVTTSATLQVSVPGTVEQYFWNSNNGDYRGVSWWGRDFTITNWTGKSVKLWVENTRLRCEVYVNQKLVGYDCVGNLPFESDITGALVSGTNKLALRVTDPDGNFGWGDYNPPISWGSQKLITSHGYGGIIGRVKVIVEDPVAIKDIYVRNKPTITDVDVSVTIANKGTTTWMGSMALDVMTTDSVPVSMYSTTVTGMNLNAGDTTIITKTISVPGAKIWDVGHGNLYNLKAVLSNGSGTAGDGFVQRFGFRWFEIVNHTTGNAMYRLNGKRIFLKSAISWGFFPANGMYSSQAIAEAQVAAAQTLGLNMLNFHRCIGQTIILDVADEKGLLYYEEPGAYSSYIVWLWNTGLNNSTLPRTDWNNFGLGRSMAHQKVLRMVMRDRSHPALIQFNMVNEPGVPPIDEAIQDMKDMHRLDPSRFTTYGSGFMNEGDNGVNKLHMLPNDSTQYYYGFCDIHNLSGMANGSYEDSSYNNPTNYQRYSTDTKEIRFWGEENSVAALPRLQKLYDYYSNGSNPPGWDGTEYINRYNGWKNYIASKNLAAYYPSIESVTVSTGNVTYYAQGRGLENALISDVSDGYVSNGWECMKLDNFSGMVDQLRDLKGNVKYYADYSRPLYIAVKARDKIGHIGDQIIVDLFIVNQNALPGGSYTLTLQSRKPNKTTTQVYNGTVTVTGGDKFGELLVENITVNLDGGKGYYHLLASLSSGASQVANGHDEILAVDWKSMALSTSGAIACNNPALTTFLKTAKGLNLPAFSTSLGTLKYIVTGPLTGGATTFSSDDVLNRVNTDGTSLIILDSTGAWMQILKNKGIVPTYATMIHGNQWVGGGFLVRAYPLYNDLPVNCAMNWEYQTFVRYKDHTSFGFQLTGENPVVTDWNSGDSRVCTAVGIIPYGKGKILFSTIPITPSLSQTINITNVPKKVLCNYIAWAANPSDTTFSPVLDWPDTQATGIATASTQLHPVNFTAFSRSNRTVSIGFFLQRAEPVTVSVYDLSGHKIATLVDKNLGQGSYRILWDAKSVASGFYTVRMREESSAYAKVIPIVR